MICTWVASDALESPANAPAWTRLPFKYSLKIKHQMIQEILQCLWFCKYIVTKCTMIWKYQKVNFEFRSFKDLENNSSCVIGNAHLGLVQHGIPKNTVFDWVQNYSHS